MSDWTDEIQSYEDRNYDDLVEGFVEKYDSLWNDFAPIDGVFEDVAYDFIQKNEELWDEYVSERFFNSGPFERMGIREN